MTLFLSALLPLEAQHARTFTVADYLAIRQPLEARLAPDGSRVAYVVESPDTTADVWRHDIWIVSAHDMGSHRFASGVQPVWAPDSRRLAYFVDDSGFTRLVVRSIEGVAAIEGTSAKGWSEVSWSPDSRRIALTRPTADTTSGGVELCVLDVASGRLTTVQTPGLKPQDPAWSPDGESLAFSSSGDIYVAAVSGGGVRTLVSRPGLDAQPQWSPDGASIAFASAQGVPANGEIRLSIVPSMGGAVRDLGTHVDRWIAGYPPRFVAWDADGSRLYFSAISRMTNRLYTLDIARDSVVAITSAHSVLWSPSLSADARVVAYLRSDGSAPGDVYVQRLAGSRSQPVRLTRLNLAVSPFALGTRSVVRWHSSDGAEIEGLLMRPASCEAERCEHGTGRPPLVVLMEGSYGTFDQSFSTRVAADGNSRFGFEPHLLVAAGFAVLMPNVRGSWGYGSHFSQLAIGDFGLGPYHDIMSAVDALASRGLIDGHRVAIAGLFIDAYRAVFALTQTDRFRAAVVGMPVFDLTSWYDDLGPFAPRMARLIGGTPTGEPGRFARISPSSYASRLHAPTLVFAGPVPAWGLRQARALETVLHANGTPTDLFTIGNLDASDMPPSEFAALYRRELDWIVKWTSVTP